MLTEHPQDDLLIAVALSRYAHEFESVEPGNAERAWELAERFAGQHGLAVEECVSQLD